MCTVCNFSELDNFNEHNKPKNLNKKEEKVLT